MASRLFSKLKEMGHTVWLDVEMLDKSEAAMEEAVVNSKCVIALITEGPGPDDAYLSRPFCLQELRWAKASEMTRLQPVVSMDDKKKIGQFLAAAPDDLRKEIGGIEFVDLNLTDPECAATATATPTPAAIAAAIPYIHHRKATTTAHPHTPL